MRHGSLFSGIGGFDLAAQWMGWDNLFHCEWNEFGQKVLNYYWPDAESFTDITKTDFTPYATRIDVLTGGFPCQPYSIAGKRKGKADSRHLWPEMLRAVREIRPRWIVGENVFGLINWSGGMVFNEVQADLEIEGYQVFPYVLPAVSVNAPHRRDRVWFVAYRDYTRNSAQRCSNCGNIQKEIENRKQSQFKLDRLYFIYTNRKRCQKCNLSKITAEKKIVSVPCNEIKDDWRNFPTESPICHGYDGLSEGLDGITFSKWQRESVKAAGNAIVPQVAFQIFKAIQQYNDNKINESL